MRVYTRFLDQWNNNSNIARKIEIERLVHIGVLEEDYSSEWASLLPTFAIPKRNVTIRVVTDFRKLNLLLKRKMSPISYSKDWGHDPFNGSIFVCDSIGLKYGLLSYQTSS
jgi:hypothetical protein